jgi:ankyrin repeat protein
MNNKYFVAMFLCLTCVGVVINIAAKEARSEETIELSFDPNTSLSWEEITQQAPYNLEDSKIYYQQAIEQYIQLGGDPQAKTIYGWTVIHAAVFCDSKKLVQLLIDKGVDVNVKASGMTPIGEAIGNENKEIIELLIDSGVNVNAKDDRGNTILHQAAYRGSQKIVEFLIAKGADINIGGNYLLAFAVSSSNKELVELLVDRGLNIQTKTDGDRTLISWAIEGRKHEKNLAMVEFLIAKGVDIQNKNSFGETLLHEAARIGDREIVELLLDRGLDFQAKDNEGETLLHEAAWSNNTKLLQFLLDRGLAVNTEDNNGETVIYELFKHYVELYRSLDRTIIFFDSDGEIISSSPIDTDSFIESIELLIDRGADINARTKDGYTALHYVAMNGYSDMKILVELSIVKGADVNAKTNDGKTPLDIIESVFGGNPEIIEILKQNGAVSSDRTDKI